MKNLIIFLFLFSITAKAAEVEVKGVCQEKIAPDLFSFNIEVFHVDKNLKKSFREANRKYKDVINHYKGDFKIQTEAVNTFEEFDYSNRQKKFIGHKTLMRLKVQTKDQAKLEQGLYSLFNFKDIKVSGVQILISPEKMNEKKEECFLKAVANAKIKASKVARKIGEKVKKVLKVSEIGGSMPQAPRPMFKRQMMQAAESTPIEAMDQTLTVEALIIVETEK